MKMILIHIKAPRLCELFEVRDAWVCVNVFFLLLGGEKNRGDWYLKAKKKKHNTERRAAKIKTQLTLHAQRASHD